MIVLINIVKILTKSTKMTTLALFKIKLLWNNVYDVIIPVHDVANKVLSCDSIYIVDVVMRPKFCNSSISMREVIITSILYRFDQRNDFFLNGSLSLSSIT